MFVQSEDCIKQITPTIKPKLISSNDMSDLVSELIHVTLYKTNKVGNPAVRELFDIEPVTIICTIPPLLFAGGIQTSNQIFKKGGLNRASTLEGFAGKEGGDFQEGVGGGGRLQFSQKNKISNI